MWAGRVVFSGGSRGPAPGAKTSEPVELPPAHQHHAPLVPVRDTLVPMIEATYKGVKIELEITQNEDGNWAAWCSLKWPDGKAEQFAGKYSLASEQSAHASALEQVHHYIDRRESEKSQTGA